MMPDSNLPQHIAVIMDGNGRWAKKRFMPRMAGHKAGVEAARQIVKSCAKRQIKVLTLFAFSSENWQRPPTEVSYLMELFFTALDREVKILHENNIHLRLIGDRSRFSEKLMNKMLEVEELTKRNKGMTLLIAIDYGGQWDICQAVKKLAQDVEKGNLRANNITPSLFAKHLSFADLPDPDLFIRTSGEFRISNFMLWQIAYAELYFTNTLWPDFNEAELEKSLQHFATRERRFGARLKQLNE